MTGGRFLRSGFAWVHFHHLCPHRSCWVTTKGRQGSAFLKQVLLSPRKPVSRNNDKVFPRGCGQLKVETHGASAGMTDTCLRAAGGADPSTSTGVRLARTTGRRQPRPRRTPLTPQISAGRGHHWPRCSQQPGLLQSLHFLLSWAWKSPPPPPLFYKCFPSHSRCIKCGWKTLKQTNPEPASGAIVQK